MQPAAKAGTVPAAVTAGEPGKPDRGAGAGGGIGVCNASLENGGSAPVGDDGLAASAFGTISAVDGFKPSAGTAGKDGEPGQGGGGGGGSSDVGNGGGGGGGCGGCGGAGGSSAGGGGASVAVLVLGGEGVILDTCILTSKVGGAGGTGSAGQDGQTGGNGGLQTSGACPGGKGGSGGKGGASAGGAAGVSAAVLYKGSAPKNMGSTLTFGESGKVGKGGKPGGNDGPSVQSGELVALP